MSLSSPSVRRTDADLMRHNPATARYEGLLPDGRTVVSVAADLYERTTAKVAGAALPSALCRFAEAWHAMRALNPDDDIQVYPTHLSPDDDRPC